MKEGQSIETRWADPETRNERELLETIAIKRDKLKIPLEQAWREAGYSEERIGEMQAMLGTEREAEASPTERFLQSVEGF